MPPPTMFFQLQSGTIINLWQIVSVTDEARAVESEIAPGILVRFSDDTGLSLVGPDAIAISQLLHMHSLRSRLPEDSTPKIVAPVAGKIVV